MRRHLGWYWALWSCAILFVARVVWADAYDPPAAYYATATGSGAALKQQLNDIIDGHNVQSYGAARSLLQNTDEDPNNPDHMLLVYDRLSLDVSAINPGGTIPGWDDGNSWDREHTWPKSRGVGESGADTSDLHHLRPSTPSVNSSRGNSNFGGAYGTQPFGYVNDGGAMLWYPGDADAGMIARAEFYMAVRYDGSDPLTTNLELGNGNVADVPGDTDPPPQLGSLNRLIEWHFATPPDDFERRRNQLVYGYQVNRNPFTDRPELAWSVFVDQMNDSRIVVDGASVDSNGGSTLNLDLGRVYVGGELPSPQTLTLNKLGDDGTYFEVTAAGAATSSLSGRFHAFRTGMTDSSSLDIGLDTSTATAGVKSGTVTIDNLDVTTGGGVGRGTNDADDTINISLAVLDHPTASYSANIEQRHEIIDFGIVPFGSGQMTELTTITSLAAAGFPSFAADLDLDFIDGTGDTDVLQLELAPFTGLSQGDFIAFDSVFDTAGVGMFSADYTLNLSDEDLPGEQTQTLTLLLIGEVILSGDYNRDHVVDSADYSVWRDMLGQAGVDYSGADGDGSGVVDEADYQVWKDHFGESALGLGGVLTAATVPEPTSTLLLVMAMALFLAGGRRLAGR